MGLFGGGETPDMGGGIKELRKAQGFGSRELTEFKGNIKPYIGAGKRALGQYEAQLGLTEGPVFDVTTLPGYQASLSRGLDAVNQGGAGSGMLMSGERLKGLQSAGQQVFGDYYRDYMNRIMGLSNLGQSSVMGAGQLGQQAAGLQMQGAQGISNLMAQQEMAEAQAANAGFGDMMGMLGSVGGMMMGGPLGASIGGAAGSAVGGGGGGQIRMPDISQGVSGTSSLSAQFY